MTFEWGFRLFLTKISNNLHMTINDKMVVSLSYRLSVNTDASTEEVLVEETNAEQPFVFIYGLGGLLEEFENNLRGLKAGDAFDFVIQIFD